jgi:hypothetical protein
MDVAIGTVHAFAIEIASAFKVRRRLQFRIVGASDHNPTDDEQSFHESCFPFETDIRELQEFLSGIQATGGRNQREDWVGALERVLALNWRDTAERGIIWITDPNAHSKRYCGDEHQ